MQWAVLGFILWHSPQTSAQARCWSLPLPLTVAIIIWISQMKNLPSHGQKKAKPQAKVCPGLFGANYDMTPTVLFTPQNRVESDPGVGCGVQQD